MLGGCLGSDLDASGCISSAFVKMKKSNFSNFRAFLKAHRRLGPEISSQVEMFMRRMVMEKERGNCCLTF